jgi:tetratricopeptide (TPR) repeat protein
VFAGLLYLGTLHNDFVWDDRALVVENTEISTFDWPTVEHLFTNHYFDFKATHGGYYRPLSALSLCADVAVYGKQPAGFHLTNLLLNAAVCVLAFLLLVELLGNRFVALMASLLFAAHPLHTENVAWVAGRTDVIAMLCILLSLLGYAVWQRSGRTITLALSVVAFALALLAKEIAIVLPALVVLIATGPFLRGEHPVSRRGRLLSAVPYVIVAVFYMVVRTRIIGATTSAFIPFAKGIAGTAALSLSILAHYVYKLVYPFRLNAEFEVAVPTTFWNLHTLAGIVMVALCGWASYRWRKRADIIFALGVFAFGVAPVLNIIPIAEVSAERFVYLPSLGFTLVLAVVAAAGLARNRLLTITLCTALLAAWSVRTVLRTHDWHDANTLFTVTAAVASDNARVHANLGSSLYHDGRYDEALAEFTRASQISPNFADAWDGLARVEGALGKKEEAFAAVDKAIALAPEQTDIRNTQGLLYVRFQDYENAVRCFRAILTGHPGSLQARYNLGLALYFQGNNDDAIRELTALDHKDTDFVFAYYYLAKAEARRGDREAAASYASQFLQHYSKDDRFAQDARAMTGR